jgi:hypothetical protein
MTELLAIIQSFDWSWVWTIVQVLQSLGIFWPVVKVGGIVLAFLWCFWVLYVATMAVYRLHLAGELKAATTSKVTLALCYSLVGIAVLVDAIAQYTVASLVFLEFPDRGEHLVTDRLQRHMARTTANWRSSLADWICLHILDLFDPSRNHCNRRSAA